MHSSDYANGNLADRQAQIEINVPDSATFSTDHFHLTSTALSATLSTSPHHLPSATYVIRLRVTQIPTTRGWVMSQSPDHGWSRALAINDQRLGYVGQTPGFDSTLGQVPVGSWIVLIGIWTQNGNCQTWLHGSAGQARTCSSGSGTNAETLVIGGRNVDDSHNPNTIDISHALVYNRAITDAEVAQITDSLSSGSLLCCHGHFATIIFKFIHKNHFNFYKSQAS